jgi:hypothetical protein
MDVLEGVLVTGVLATGVVVAERLRGKRRGEDVREDVTEFGSSVADQVGKASGFVGHAGSRALTWTGDWTESVGDTTTKVVSSVGHKMAEGTGYVFGVYAGALDRVLPGGGKLDDEETVTAAKKTTKRTAKSRTRSAA